MGLAVARLAHADDIGIAGAIVSPSSKDAGRDLGEVAGLGSSACHSPDVTRLPRRGRRIDFSARRPPPGARQRAAARAGRRDRERNGRGSARTAPRLDVAAQKVPLLLAPNTSVGVHVLRELAAAAGEGARPRLRRRDRRDPPPPQDRRPERHGEAPRRGPEGEPAPRPTRAARAERDGLSARAPTTRSACPRGARRRRDRRAHRLLPRPRRAHRAHPPRHRTATSSRAARSAPPLPRGQARARGGYSMAGRARRRLRTRPGALRGAARRAGARSPSSRPRPRAVREPRVPRRTAHCADHLRHAKAGSLRCGRGRRSRGVKKGASVSTIRRSSGTRATTSRRCSPRRSSQIQPVIPRSSPRSR